MTTNERQLARGRRRLAAARKLDQRLSTQAANLATQDTELVAEHDDLQLLELARAEAKCGQLQHTSNNEVHKRDEQGGSS